MTDRTRPSTSPASWAMAVGSTVVASMTVSAQMLFDAAVWTQIVLLAVGLAAAFCWHAASRRVGRDPSSPSLTAKVITRFADTAVGSVIAAFGLGIAYGIESTGFGVRVLLTVWFVGWIAGAQLAYLGIRHRTQIQNPAGQR
ncbi:hypothetical protein [Salininema proteolyticum]|uniref:Uncharacterized protein n=1 Tax=Salininema proteolyticum TaxID=1607685 RepID=A0ABV8U2F1_9ACTN